jgi:hypothetical protein
MDEDDALTRRGRALLVAYRAETGPTSEQADRLLAAIHRSAVNDEEADAPAPSLARRADGGRTRAIVVGIGSLAAAVLAAFAWLGGQARHDPRGRHDAAVDQAKGHTGGGEAVDSGPPRSTAAPETTAPTSVQVDEPLRAPAGPGRPTTPVRKEVPPAQETEPGPMAEASADALAGELAFVREVHALLAAGDPAGALARVDEYPRLHTTGLLREEVAALRVIAGCGLRRDAAAAAAFEQAHPRSLFAERVRRSCETTNETPAGRTPTPRTYP